MNEKEKWSEWFVSVYGKTSYPKLHGSIALRLYEAWEAGWKAAKCCNNDCKQGRECPARK
jgi:hypothetical protein